MIGKGKKKKGQIAWIKDLIEFIKLQREIGVFLFGWILTGGVKIKKGFSYSLYRERGKYGGLVGHSSVAVLVILGVVLSRQVEQWLFYSKQEREGAGIVLASDLARAGADTLVSERPRGEVTSYRVKEGDTVSGIAQKFGVSIDTVVWNNNLNSVDDIKPGQILEIPPVTGMIHTVKRGETVYSVAKRYQADAQGIVDYPFNSFLNDENFSLSAGQRLIVPDGIKPEEKVSETPRYVAKEVAPIPGVVGEGNFIWPTAGRITQRFSWYHRGTDIANSTGTTVVAAQGGTVTVAGWGGGYGNNIIVDHGNGQQTHYAHLSSFAVAAGAKVSQGQKIGEIGSTGRSTGPHLHFEIISGGNKVDPLAILK